MIIIFKTYIRNLQKKAKKARYEREKSFMDTLRQVGCPVGEYIGDGLGEAESAELQAVPPDDGAINAGPVESNKYKEGVENDSDNDDNCEIHGTRPLLVLYDCETTGLSIYKDHITDIGAKVLNPPTELSAPIFSSLVRTGRTISSIGNLNTMFDYYD